MSRVSFGIGEDEQMIVFWEGKLKGGDECAKDVYGYRLWEKYVSVSKFERTVQSLQSRARRIVPLFYMWNWTTDRKIKLYQMWQKNFADDMSTLRAIEKYCHVNTVLYPDGTIKTWTHKSKSQSTRQGDDRGKASRADDGSERVVIEDSDTDLQEDEVVKSKKQETTIWISEDDGDAEFESPKKKKLKLAVAHPGNQEPIVEEPPNTKDVTLVLEDEGDLEPLNSTPVIEITEGEPLAVEDAQEEDVDPINSSAFSIEDADSVNFTKVIENIKKTYNTNHEMREYLGKPPITTPPHLKKSLDIISPLEPTQAEPKNLEREDHIVPAIASKVDNSRDTVVPVQPEKLKEGAKNQQDDISSTNQTDSVKPQICVAPQQPKVAEQRAVIPSQQPTQPEKIDVGINTDAAPASCDKSTMTTRMTSEGRNEVFSAAFTRLRECYKHINPENVPQFRAVERKIEAGDLTPEQFCERVAVEFEKLVKTLRTYDLDRSD